MTRKVRIVRNTVSLREAQMRFMHLVMVVMAIYDRHTRAAAHDYVTEVRMEKVRKDIELGEMRRQKLCNDLVIQDLKIEKMNSEAGHPVPPEWTYHNNMP